MPLYFKRKVLAIKPEVTYGTDTVPTAADNAVLARNIRINPLQQNYDEKTREMPYVGAQGQIVAGSWVTMEFDVEIAGAGAAGSASPDSAVLKACAMAETLNAGVSAVYTPVQPGAATSCSIYFFMGGRRHRITGVLGNVEFEFVRGRVPLKKYSMVGLYNIPTDVSLPTPTLTAFQAPLAVNNTNTTPVTLHSFAGEFAEIRLSTGNEINYRNLVGSEAVRFTDRKSTGRVVLEDELVATKDWWTIVKAGTLGTLSVVHGTAAGNIATLAGSNVQLTNPSMSQDQNIAMLGLDLEFVPSSAGSDEWSLTLT